MMIKENKRHNLKQYLFNMSLFFVTVTRPITFITPNKNGRLTTGVKRDSIRLKTQQVVIMSGTFHWLGVGGGKEIEHML